MIVDRINNNLSALFDIDDPIYKSLICDKDGTYGNTIPTDNDIGAIASEIEYLRQVGIYFLQQLYIDQASGEFLKYTLETFFNSFRLEDETDDEWIQRTFTTVFQQKVSRASIIYALTPYSDTTPVIDNLLEESAFADFSYSGVYVEATSEYDGETVFILPAIAESEASSSFTIRITLTNTTSDDIFTVQSILENIIAAGIFYILQIEYT